MENTVLKVAKIKCIDCGKEFEFSPAEQKFYVEKGFSFPKRCPECRNKKKTNIIKITCVDCGIEFELNGYEQEYFAKKGYELPKRCRSCRDFKKKKNEERIAFEAELDELDEAIETAETEENEFDE